MSLTDLLREIRVRTWLRLMMGANWARRFAHARMTAIILRSSSRQLARMEAKIFKTTARAAPEKSADSLPALAVVSFVPERKGEKNHE
jgi:CRP-like cAMP-binding protein